MSITIRNYTNEDKLSILGMFDDFQDYLISIDPLNRMRRMPGYAEVTLRQTLEEVTTNRGTFFVAVDVDNKVVGFVVAITFEPSQDALLSNVPSLRGRITELYVDPSRRGQGIGTLLVHAAEQYLQKLGCDVIRLEVFAPNENAYRLYRRLGYRDYDIDMIKKI
jgi:ribosomal protein S18 acetylase RimI-like enzyme